MALIQEQDTVIPATSYLHYGMSLFGRVIDAALGKSAV